MTTINDVTTLDINDEVAVLTLNSPPVNALSANVREGLNEGVGSAIKNEEVKYSFSISFLWFVIWV